MTDSLSNALAKYLGASMAASSVWMIRSASLGGHTIAWVPRLIDEVIKRLSGANLKPAGRNGDAESQLLRSIEQQQREGAIDEGAATLLENVVDFASTDVGEVMTPRTDIDGLEYTDDLTEIRRFIGEVGHSRIPVFEEDLDQRCRTPLLAQFISQLLQRVPSRRKALVFDHLVEQPSRAVMLETLPMH